MRACVRACARSGCLVELDRERGCLPTCSLFPFLFLAWRAFPSPLCEFCIKCTTCIKCIECVKRIDKVYKMYNVYKMYKVYKALHPPHPHHEKKKTPIQL